VNFKALAAAAFNARVIPSVAYTDPEVAFAAQGKVQPNTSQKIQICAELGFLGPIQNERPRVSRRLVGLS
jgi:hypothetical protein